MEALLFKLFDFQRFAKNEKLSSLIDDTGSRYSGSVTDDRIVLSDDELGMAAGGVSTDANSEKKKLGMFNNSRI